jgi:hypothetical protein
MEQECDRNVNCPSRQKNYADDTMSSESLIIWGKTSYRSYNLMETKYGAESNKCYC